MWDRVISWWEISLSSNVAGDSYHKRRRSSDRESAHFFFTGSNPKSHTNLEGKTFFRCFNNTFKKIISWAKESTVLYLVHPLKRSLVEYLQCHSDCNWILPTNRECDLSKFSKVMEYNMYWVERIVRGAFYNSSKRGLVFAVILAEVFFSLVKWGGGR